MLRLMPDRTPTDYSLLIPEMRDWNDGKGINIEGWLNYAGNYKLAIGFSSLFWPEFAEHDQCVLYAPVNIESYNHWMEACKGDRRAVEAVKNHRHMLDLFHQDSANATAARLIHIGRVLKDILSVKLGHDFPNRTFEVAFDEGPFENLVDYQVTFWQPANEPKP